MTGRHLTLSYCHFERSEKSLLFAAHRTMLERAKTESLLSRSLRALTHIYSRRSRHLHSSFEQSFQTESKERSAPWAHSASGNKKLPILISPCQGRHGKYLKNYSRKFHVGVLASAWDLRHFVMPRISLCISESACFRQSGTVQGSSHSELPCELPLVS